MFSACTSIKVAALLNKIADLPKEHFSPLDPILYFQLLFLRLPVAAVETCSHCRLVPAGGASNRDAIGLHGCSRPKREYRGNPEKK